MTNTRILVESAFRDIGTLLTKARASEAVQREVRARFLKLLADLVTSDELAAQGNPEPASILCADIVQDVVSQVVNVMIPKRDANKWELEAVKRSQRIYDVEAQVEHLNSMIAELQGEIDRRDAAHHYLLSTYFREVFLLRREREMVSHERDAFAYALAMAGPQSGVAVVGAATTTSMDGLPPRAAASPTYPPASPKLPILRGGSAGSRLETPAATRPPSAPNFPTPQRVPGSPLYAMPPPGTATICVTPAPVNPEAIFDYEQYLQLHSSGSADVVHKYMALMAEHRDYVARSTDEREALVANYKRQVESRDRKIELLSAAVVKSGSLLQAARAQVELEKERLLADRAAITKQLTDALAMNRDTTVKVLTSLESLREYDSLTTGLVAKASQLIATEAAVAGSSPEAEAAAREAFQNHLMPGPTETERTRMMKLYLRRHDITGQLLAAVLAVRKGVGSAKQVSKRLQVLGEYSLKENVERMRTAKVLNDVKALLDNPNHFQMASIAEAAHLSTDRTFLQKLREAADDLDFQMHDHEREMISQAFVRQDTRIRNRVVWAFHAVRHRAKLSRIRYIFELRDGASDMEYPGLDSRLDVLEHTQRLITIRNGYIQKCIDARASLRNESTEDSTQLVSALSAELLWRVLRGIRRRSKVLSKDDDQLPATTTDDGEHADVSQDKQRSLASEGGLQRKFKAVATAAVAVAAVDSAAALREANQHHATVIAQMQLQIGCLESENASLRLQLDALIAAKKRKADSDDDDTIGFRVLTAPIHVPAERFIPTMGGIGLPPTQQRSIQILKSDPRGDPGSARVKTARPPSHQRPQSTATPSGSARRSPRVPTTH